MSNSYFRDCFTIKEVNKVFKQQKLLIEKSKNGILKLLKNGYKQCPDCKGSGFITSHVYERSFECKKCKGYGIIKIK